MSASRENLRTATGVTLSLLLHGLVLLPWIHAVSTEDGATLPLDSDQLMPEPMQSPPPRPPLGIDAPTPSSLTWVGYEEYEEHLAQLSDVEQATFTEAPQPVSPVTVTATPAAPIVEVLAAQRAETDVTDPASATSTVTAAETTVPTPLIARANTPEQEATQRDETVASQQPEIGGVLPLPEAGPDLLAQHASADDPRIGSPAEVPGPPIPADAPLPAQHEAQLTTADVAPLVAGPPVQLEQAAAEMSAAESATATTRKPAAQPTSPPTKPDEGDPAEKQSDATSTVEVPLDQLKAGKPLANQGLELLPVKPEFSITTQLTVWPNNPLVEINFRANGKPKLASVVESSGDAIVDENILSSLYRWRARGKRLADLKADETIDVRIRIILR